METGVGASLREARKRRQLELADAEAAIKIRARYLQAIEDEDWDVLPGGVYARGFIRTYAAYLGLDGERLAEEYRRAASEHEGERDARRPDPAIAVGTPPVRRRRLGGRALSAAVVLALLALLVAVGLVGDEEGDSPSPRQAATASERSNGAGGRTSVAARPGVSLGLEASGEVWVCLLDAAERPLLDGEILPAGGEAGPFRSEGFAVAFGNGAVVLRIDGVAAKTPASSGPVGYEVDAGGELRPLAEGERPDCT